jgi:DNA-binding response OmpR family regulator
VPGLALAGTGQIAKVPVTPTSGARGRILLAEEDRALAERFSRALRNAGFAPTAVGTAALALAVVERTQLDLILAGRVPDSDRRRLCTELRHRSGAPIVMLADSVEQADRDAARDGVDDYIVKPFGAAEAVVRIRAVLRRARQADEAHRAVLRVGPLELDTAARRARLEGTELRLSAKELDLLARLARDAGRVVTREQLMSDVWGVPDDGSRSSRTLEVHVGMLRRKLDDPAGPRFIRTVRGVGFRLVSEEELAGATAPA